MPADFRMCRKCRARPTRLILASTSRYRQRTAGSDCGCPSTCHRAPGVDETAMARRGAGRAGPEAGVGQGAGGGCALRRSAIVIGSDQVADLDGTGRRQAWLA